MVVEKVQFRESVKEPMRENLRTTRNRRCKCNNLRISKKTNNMKLI